MVLDPAALDRLITAFGAEGPGVVAELVATFLAEAPARLEALRMGVADGDGASVRRAAHSLKAAAATLGTVDLAGLCGRVEALALASDLGAAAELVPVVEASYDEARQALEAVVG